MSEILNESELDIILALHSNNNIKSISEPIKIGDESESKLEDVLPSNELSIEEMLLKMEIKNTIYNLIEKLDIREQIIIRHSYGLNCTEKSQKEIAEMLNISQTRVSDIKKRAISELKYYLANRNDILDLLSTDNKIINCV